LEEEKGMIKRLLLKVFVSGIFLLFLGNSMHCSIQGISPSQPGVALPSYGSGHRSISNSTEYFAVICACSQYENPKYNLPRPFPAPESKLRVLYDALLQTKNWDERHIILLLNENATRQNIIHALEMMSMLVGPNDIFLFTWNGHGSEINDTNGDEAVWNPDDTYDEVICPYDTIKSDGNLTNVITDDELGYYFSNIQGKGKCLIFESCLSGALIDQQISKIKNSERKKTSLVKTIFSRVTTNPETMDVNGENTVVIMSTLPSTLGRATFTTHSPLLYSIATIVENSKRYDRNNDGFLSVEEIFQKARPRMLIQSSFYWIFLWISGYISFKFDMYDIYTSLLPHFVKLYRLYETLVPIPILSATGFLLFVYLGQQLHFKLGTGHYLLNWPTMQDNYPGDLPFVQL
jgi:hypothetical protein